MRAAVLLLLVAACRIPDEHFAVRDGNPGDDDAMHDAMPDAPPAPRGKLYLADPDGGLMGAAPGVFLVIKDAQGDVKLASPGVANPVSPTNTSFLLVGKDGTQLYTLEASAMRLAHYAIQADGTLLAQTDTLTLATAGVHMALDPTGQWIAIVSATNTIVIATLDATGKLLSQTSKSFLMAKFHQVAFTRDGTCLIAVSNGTGGTPPPRIWSIQFAAGTLTTSVNQAALANALTLALRPDGTLAYVGGTIPGGGIAVQAFALGAGCTLDTGTTAVPVSDLATNTPVAGLALDPAGRFLFATGSAITRVTLDGSGGITTSHATYLPQQPPAGGTSQPGVQIAFDPAVPDHLYATGPGYQKVTRPGAIAVGINAAGSLTQVAGAYPEDPGAQPQALVLAP